MKARLGYGEDPDARDREIFGERYRPPAQFGIHVDWHAVARFEKTGSDGQDVEIDECRMPARFYRLRALASTNSCGDPIAAWTLSTGSGDEVGRLMVALAEQIAEGMVTLEPGKDGTA